MNRIYSETKDGILTWYNSNGQIHRCDSDGSNVNLPAVEHLDGSNEWFINGKRHRCGPNGVNLDLPAVELAIEQSNNQSTERQSIEQPAIECRQWFWNGQLHRCGPNGVNNDLPAVEWANGSREWWVDGQLHRDNGFPAIVILSTNQGEYNVVRREWWVRGQRHRVHDDGSNVDLPAVELSDGGREWWVNGERHRSGGFPAIEYTNGHKEWWVHGQLHRSGTLDGSNVDLPAVENARVYKKYLLHPNNPNSCVQAYRTILCNEWWINGKLHRQDKNGSIDYPAVICGDYMGWYNNDEYVRYEGEPDDDPYEE